MKPKDPENDIYLTILGLSGIDNEQEVTAGFISALNTIYPEIKFTFSNSSVQGGVSSVEVRTNKELYGYLYYSGSAINEDDKRPLANAAGILALLLENICQSEAISELEKNRNEMKHNTSRDERFDRMAAISPAVISEYTITSEKKLVYRYISPAAANVYGYTSYEIIRDPEILRSRINQDDRKKILITYDSDPHLPRIRYVARYNHPVKGEVWLQSHSNLAPQPDGSIHVYDFVIDITEQKRIEEKLRESEERYRGIYENAAIGIYLATLDGQLISVNPALARMHGFETPDEMISTISTGIEPSVDFEEKKRLFSKLSRKEEFNYFEIEMHKKDLSTFWVSISSRIVNNTEGNPVYFEGVVEDITERKLVMNRLRDKEAQFEKLTTCIPGMLFQFQMKPDGSFCVPYCSSQIKDIFGCEPQDVRDTFDPMLRVVLPDDREIVSRTIRESAAGLTPWMAEFRIQLPGQNIKWIMGNSIPEKSEDGTITWHGFDTDITALKKTEDDLRASNEQMRNIVENTEEIIHIIDREGIFHFLSPSWEKSTGFKLSETIGASFLPYVHPEDAPACLQVLMNVLNTGEPHKINEFRVKHASGKWIWFSNSGVALKDASGNTVNFLGVASDITDRKIA